MSEKYETIVPSEPDAGERLQWVSWLRSAAPYVHLHHGRTFVISFAGEVVADRTLLNHLVMDVSLIASMGMRVVLVHGSRPQIEELMSLRKLEGQFYKGVRITGPQELECVKEACGETRFDIEAAFSQGLPNTPMQHSRIKVVSGNFVTARPMGIIDGVDYLHTGVVRKVDAESIQDLLSRGNIVLVSPTGFSPTGEAFNLTTEDVATAIAVAIHADKLILSVGVDGVRIQGEKQQDLTAQQAQALIQSKQVDDEDVYNLGYALRAIKGGVDRVDGSYPVVALSTYRTYGDNNAKKYKFVMLVGSTDFGSDAYVTNTYGNRSIIYSATRNMATDRVIPDIDIKRFEETALTLTTEQAEKLTWFVTLTFPLVIICIGFAVFVRRRHL